MAAGPVVSAKFTGDKTAGPKKFVKPRVIGSFGSAFVIWKTVDAGVGVGIGTRRRIRYRWIPLPLSPSLLRIEPSNVIDFGFTPASRSFSSSAFILEKGEERKRKREDESVRIAKGPTGELCYRVASFYCFAMDEGLILFPSSYFSAVFYRPSTVPVYLFSLSLLIFFVTSRNGSAAINLCPLLFFLVVLLLKLLSWILSLWLF